MKVTPTMIAPDPQPQKEACVIALDVSNAMGKHLETAKQAVQSMMQRKILFSKKDEVALQLAALPTLTWSLP